MRAGWVPAGDPLERAVAGVVEARGLELWEVSLSGSGRHARVTVTVDRPGGVGLQHLEGLNGPLGVVLDPLVPWTGGYSLDIESPGPCRRLRNLEDVRRFIGVPVAISLHQPEGGRRHFKGVVETVSDAGFVIAMEPAQHLDLVWDNIQEARVDG
ncbi:MAG: hypothetical protein ACYCOS_07465 [Sulfobacillus sp.]